MVTRQEPGELWKARAPEPKGSVQAQTVGIAALGVDRVVADKAQTHCPGLERLDPWFWKNRSCLDTYELLTELLPDIVSLDVKRDADIVFAQNQPVTQLTHEEV